MDELNLATTNSIRQALTLQSGLARSCCNVRTNLVVEVHGRQSTLKQKERIVRNKQKLAYIFSCPYLKTFQSFYKILTAYSEAMCTGLPLSLFQSLLWSPQSPIVLQHKNPSAGDPQETLPVEHLLLYSFCNKYKLF